MRKMLNELAKTAIAVVLGMFYMWFLLSFAWSAGEMSLVEKIVGLLYGAALVPAYEFIKKVAGLR